MLGPFHTACGGLALLLGAQIFLSTKGTRTHVRVGWLYVASMLSVNLSSLFLYNLTGGPNLFHALAIMNLVMVITGVLQVMYRHRLRNWLWRHYTYMCWSYVGLLAATNNEAFVRVGPLKKLVANTVGWLPLAATAVLVAISALIISLRQNHMMMRYGKSS